MSHMFKCVRNRPLRSPVLALTFAVTALFCGEKKGRVQYLTSISDSMAEWLDGPGKTTQVLA